MPNWMSVSFQDSVGPFLGNISYLHDHVMMIMLLVVFFISYLLCYLLTYNSFYKFFSEGSMIETIWSIIPALLLIILVLPSMQILYLMEDVKTPSTTYKIIGHQWYWTYISPLYNNLHFMVNSVLLSSYDSDSMMNLESNFPRLLGCSSNLMVPSNSTSRFLISSTDVIHSFSLPSLALKVDALPGRINQIFCFPHSNGLFFGQCSEICGSNHSFMPIMLKVVNSDTYSQSSMNFLLGEVLGVDSFNF